MSSDLVSNPVHLSNVLAMLSANKTETIKQGEKLLRPAQKQPMFLLSLLNQIRESPVPEIRHHAALIMKKQLMKCYKKVGIANQNLIKTQLLTIMKTEPVKSVGVSIAGCVAKLAEAIFSVGPEWNDLFAVIVELSQSPNEAHRELNFSLLEQLVERIPMHLKPHTVILVQMLARGFEDPNLHVATSAMQATAGFISSLKDKPEVLQLKVLLTPILNLLQKCIQNGEEAAAAEGLAVFEECVTMKQPLINDHVDQIIPFVAAIIQNDSYEPQLKQAAGNTLMTIIEYRPKLVAKKQMVAPTLHAVASIIAQSDASTAGSLFSFNEESGVYTEGDDENEDDDDDEADMQKLAHVIIDVMAVSIPSKYFIGPALDISAQGMQSPDPKMRKAGCTILGIIAEGCADAVRQMLPSIMPHLIAAAGDAEQGVKETAFFALGQFSENCQPEILFYHETVLPALFNALDDPRHTVQTTACYVIEMFCENLQCETLRPFLKPLLTKLAVLMQSDKEVTRVMALSAISATALAADKDFLPYVDDVFNLLKHRLFTTEPESLSLRGRSLECLGQIAVSVGAQHFAPYFEIGLQSANQGIAMQNDDLKEYAYVYYANTSKAMGKMFSPVLPQLVPHLLEMIGETELIFDDDSDEEASEAEEEENNHITTTSGTTSASTAITNGQGKINKNDHDDDDDEFEDDEDDDLGIRINGREGYVNTKRTAITAIGSIARYTRADFYPYLKATFDAIIDDRNGPIMSYHDSIKMEAFESFQYLCGVACAYHGISNVEVDSKINNGNNGNSSVMTGIKTPTKGVSIVLPEDLYYLIKTSLKLCIDACEEEDAKGVVACAYQSITGILGLVGIVALSLPYEKERVVQGVMGQKLLQVILTTCQQKLPCQIDHLENNEEEEEEEQGSGAHSHSHHHHNRHHKSHAAAGNEEDENQDDDHDSLVMDDVTDCIGMLAKIMGASFTTHFDILLPELLKFLEPSRMHSDRSMAIGCLGEVIAEIGPQAEKYIQVALPVVSAGLSDEMEGVRRNSAFFLAALIESTGKSLAPNFIQILTWLYPLCTRKPNQQAFDTGGADVDNALSAVGKMISLAPELIPLPQVLPVLLAALPLRSDNTEGPSVYGALTSLIMIQNPIAIQHFPSILQSFGQVLSPDSKAIDETKVLIISCLKSMITIPQQNTLLINTMTALQTIDPIMAASISHAINSV